MARSHWDAFMETPKIFMKDWMAVFFHAAISRHNESLIDKSRTSIPGNNIVPYLIDGISYTLRQDYAFALIGEGAAVPDSSNGMGIGGTASGRVAY